VEHRRRSAIGASTARIHLQDLRSPKGKKNGEKTFCTGSWGILLETPAKRRSTWKYS
jgi:hypothetical protein